MLVNVVIDSGETVSEAGDIAQARLVGIVIPAAFTGTALTFQVSADGTTYQGLYDDAGSAVSLTVAQGRTYSFKVDDLGCLSQWRYIKVVSGSAEGADRTVGLWCR